MQVIWEREDFPQERVYTTRAHHPKNETDLAKSHYRIDYETGVVTHKTCTKCSQAQGRFVWLPIAKFGHRVMEDHSVRPQPQCKHCRGSRTRRAA